MFTSVASRSAFAYKRVNVETSVERANPQDLVYLLFDALQQSLLTAIGAVRRKDTATKCQAIGRAVRILEEGLKGALNYKDGGEVAENLGALYDYCLKQLTQANIHNDETKLLEVSSLIQPVADAWRELKDSSKDGHQQNIGA